MKVYVDMNYVGGLFEGYLYGFDVFINLLDIEYDIDIIVGEVRFVDDDIDILLMGVLVK